MLPDLHGDQFPNENRNLDRERMGGVKLFTPVPEWEPVFLLLLRFWSRLKDSGLGAHSLYLHCSEINSFSTESSWSCNGEDDPEELSRARAPHIPLQPGTSCGWDTSGMVHRSATRGLVH